MVRGVLQMHFSLTPLLPKFRESLSDEQIQTAIAYCKNV